MGDGARKDDEAEGEGRREEEKRRCGVFVRLSHAPISAHLADHFALQYDMRYVRDDPRTDDQVFPPAAPIPLYFYSILSQALR